MDQFQLKLSLAFQQANLISSGTSCGCFRDELLDLQKQLPPDTYLKTCINCAFSDYSPAGHGCFGGLACFRDNKAGYAAVASKWDLFRIWNSMTEFVQETHVCPEFERRRPNTGYRG
jgi:hypothetical protein